MLSYQMEYNPRDTNSGKDRRETKHNEGLIGGGRRKYNAKISEMFPFFTLQLSRKVKKMAKKQRQMTAMFPTKIWQLAFETSYWVSIVNFWLASKTTKGQQGVPYKVASKRKSNGLGSNLATVQEESGDDSIPHPESLIIECVGQRLPPPSHWFLSLMVRNLPLSTKNDLENGTQPVGKETAELEEVIKADLAFFLGFEFLTAKVPEAHSIDTKIPLVRKLHSLSTVFVSGGDVFLDSSARDLIRALQSVLGYQIGQRSANLPQTSTVGRRASGDENTSNGHGFLAASVVQDQTVPGDKM
ncbi:unnamed protein product [Calypogeia fissa]